MADQGIPDVGIRGCDVTTHPIRSLLSSLGTQLPVGWSWHHVDGNAFAFLLTRSRFSLDSWTAVWEETALIQFKNSFDPLNVHPFACDLFRKTSRTREREPQFIASFNLVEVGQITKLIRCFDDLATHQCPDDDDDVVELLPRILAAVTDRRTQLSGGGAFEFRRIPTALKCRECGTEECANWLVEADGTAACADCRGDSAVTERSGKEGEVAATEVDRLNVVDVDSNAERVAKSVVVPRRRKKFPKKPGRKPNRIFCPLCDAEFKTKKLYVEHVVLTHDKDAVAIKFACDQAGCDKVYPKKQTLKVHLAQVHGVGETPHECKHCLKSFATLGTLHSHEAAVHSTEIKIRCKFCERGFTTIGKHNLHVKVKHSSARPYKCQMCEKKFALKCILKRHERDIHTEEKQFKCSTCSYACTSQRDLTKHEEAVHQGRRDHVCESCPMRFCNRGGLLRHQRTVHERRKDFSCRFCGKTFGEKRNMESHERIHTGEKKFKCDRCDYSCVDKSNLTKHARKHSQSAKAESGGSAEDAGQNLGKSDAANKLFTTPHDTETIPSSADHSNVV